MYSHTQLAHNLANHFQAWCPLFRLHSGTMRHSQHCIAYLITAIAIIGACSAEQALHPTSPARQLLHQCTTCCTYIIIATCGAGCGHAATASHGGSASARAGSLPCIHKSGNSAQWPLTRPRAALARGGGGGEGKGKGRWEWGGGGGGG